MGQKTGLEMTGQPVGDRSETGSGYSVSDPTGSGAMATVTKGEKHLSDHFDDFQDNAPHRRAGGTA